MKCPAFYGRSEKIRTSKCPPPSHSRSKSLGTLGACYSLLWAAPFAKNNSPSYFLLAPPWSRVGSGLQKAGSSTYRFNYKSTGHHPMSCAFMVGVRRFELPASWTRTKRSTKLSHTPFYTSLFNALIFYHNLSLLSIVFFQKSRLIGRWENAYPKKSKKRKNGAQKSCNLSFRVLKYKKKAKENCLSEVLYERRYFGKHNA